MKVKEDLMLRTIYGECMVIPMGERLMEFNGMLKLNDTVAFLWKLLQKPVTREQLILKLLEEYEVDEKRANESVDDFLEMLRKENILEE